MNNNFYQNLELDDVDISLSEMMYGSDKLKDIAPEQVADMFGVEFDERVDYTAEDAKTALGLVADVTPFLGSAKALTELPEDAQFAYQLLEEGYDEGSIKKMGLGAGFGMLTAAGFLPGAKIATDLGQRAIKEFATPVKTVGRGDDKKFIPASEPIMRVEESLEDTLSPRLQRAMDTDKFPEAASILPAPARFFDPTKRDYKQQMAEGLSKAGVDLDLDFGNYVMMGQGKPADVSNKTFENLFISARTSSKKSSSLSPSKRIENKTTARANKLTENLSIKDMKENYKTNTGRTGVEVRTNLLQPEKFKIVSNNEPRVLDHPIVAVQDMRSKEKGGKHFYTLDTQFVGPVNMKKLEQEAQPNLRPSTVGDIRLGNQVGEIRIPTKGGFTTHPLYDYIEVDSVPSFSKGVGQIEKFNMGGLASVDEQMNKLMARGSN
jgi:hypothetical protein